jgi:hypothetical protein
MTTAAPTSLRCWLRRHNCHTHSTAVTTATTTAASTLLTSLPRGVNTTAHSTTDAQHNVARNTMWYATQPRRIAQCDATCNTKLMCRCWSTGSDEDELHGSFVIFYIPGCTLSKLHLI